jgi:hypothetical protein
MLCRLNDLKASGENSCVTVNSREGGRINVFEERSLNDVLLDASLCAMSMKNIHSLYPPEFTTEVFLKSRTLTHYVNQLSESWGHRSFGRFGSPDRSFVLSSILLAVVSHADFPTITIPNQYP